MFAECETSSKFMSIPTLSDRYQKTHTAVNPDDLAQVVWFILWKKWYVQ